MSKTNAEPFEFCKETEITKDGINTVYFTRRGGEFCPGSLSYDREHAYDRFKILVAHNGETKKIEVLETSLVTPV